MKILKIDKVRFMSEYQKFVQYDMKKDVNWYVGDDGLLYCYIITDYGYAYVYSVGAKEVPQEVGAVLNKNGAFFGFEDSSKSVISGLNKGFEEIKRDNQFLTLNQNRL